MRLLLLRLFFPAFFSSLAAFLFRRRRLFFPFLASFLSAYFLRLLLLLRTFFLPLASLSSAFFLRRRLLLLTFFLPLASFSSAFAFFVLLRLLRLGLLSSSSFFAIRREPAGGFFFFPFEVHGGFRVIVIFAYPVFGWGFFSTTMSWLDLGLTVVLVPSPEVFDTVAFGFPPEGRLSFVSTTTVSSSAGFTVVLVPPSFNSLASSTDMLHTRL